MHNAQSRRVVALGAGALLAQVALLAACGHRSVEIIEGCEDRAAPSCACAGQVAAPLCVGMTWHCPPCSPPPDAMPRIDAASATDTGRSLDAGIDSATGDARDGCGDDSALVCRRGCGHHVREWHPVCEGTTWQCTWGGTLEQRSTPPATCADAGSGA
jgi:hypothetical protein